MAQVNWTREQRQAIETRGKNILVAAAAGSGKTAVLVERIKGLILEEGCPIDRMLIVTFTNAAAAEMKEKIFQAINQAAEELAETGETQLAFLREQLNLLPSANISTFHAFALEIIKKYFYIIDIEPNFRICDDAQQTIMRANAMENLLEEFFDKDDPDFLAFLDAYSGDRNDDRLKEMLDKVYDTIRSLPEPKQWLHEKVEVLRRGISSTGQAAPLLDFLWEIAQQRVAAAGRMVLENRQRASAAGLAAAAALAEDDLLQIENLKAALAERDYQAMRAALSEFKLATMKRGCYSLAGDADMAAALKNAAAGNRDGAKKAVKGLKEDFFAASLEEMDSQMAATYGDGIMLEKLILRYDELYREEKQRKNLVDFGDIEHYAYEILQDEEVSRFYRERFLHIFVDEYQDSNVMQESFLERIRREDNLFLVGDVKQSIYKFRLAEPEIFQRRYREYGDPAETKSEKIDLNQNFRSKAPIIDFVNQVFDGVMEDYDENAALHMGDPCGDRFYDEPALYLAQTPWQEDEELDDELKNMMKAEKEALAAVKLIRDNLGQPIYDSKAGCERPLTMKDIVILMRGVRGYGDIFYNVLMENQLPAYVDDNDGYFDTMEINTFISLLTIIDNEKQDIPLLAVLRSEIFGFTVEELARIRMAHKEDSYYDAFMACAEASGQQLEPQPEQQSGQLKLNTKCAHALELLRSWQSLSVFMPLEELIWKLLLDTGFYLAMGAMPGGRQRQANLRALVDKALSYRRMQGGSLYGFIRYIETVKERKVPSGQVKLVGEGDELVRIMTIHKSKGLEFPMVILSGFCRNLNYTTQGRSLMIHKELGLGFPIINHQESWYQTTALQNMIKEKFHQEEVAEERRVLYVALTRAKDRLALLGIVGDIQAELDKVGTDQPKDRSYFLMTGKKLHLTMNCCRTIDDSDLVRLTSRHSRQTGRALALLDSGAAPAASSVSDELKAQVEEQMSFVYPNAQELTVKSKYSVSELNAAHHAGSNQGAAQQTADQQAKAQQAARLAGISLTEPASFKIRQAFTPMQRGTIYHCMLEHVDFKQAYAGGDRAAAHVILEATLQRLVAERFLTAEEGAVIDLSNIEKLLFSPLGKRMAESPAMYQERPFNLKMPHPQIEGSQVIVQGIIDCFFEEGGELVLVDYKTSRLHAGRSLAAEKKRIAAQYQTQLDIYRKALEIVTSKRVREAYIYLTDCGELVEMK